MAIFKALSYSLISYWRPSLHNTLLRTHPHSMAQSHESKAIKNCQNWYSDISHCTKLSLIFTDVSPSLYPTKLSFGRSLRNVTKLVTWWSLGGGTYEHKHQVSSAQTAQFIFCTDCVIHRLRLQFIFCTDCAINVVHRLRNSSSAQNAQLIFCIDCAIHLLHRLRN